MSSYSFRTAPPSTYLPPTQGEMRESADRVGLRSFSRDLVADLCNLAAGGTVVPPSQYRDKVRQKAEDSLPAPDFDGEWQLKSGSYTNDRSEAIAEATESAMKYHMNVCDFLQSVDLGQYPGSTPLEQAMSLLKMLSTQSGGTGGGEAGEPLPIFQDADRPEDVAEEMSNVLDKVDSLSEEEQDMLDPDKEESESSESGEGSQGLSKLKVAQDLMPGQDKRVMLDISRTLDQFTKMQVRKNVKLEQDPAGDEVRQRPIAHLGELGRVSKSAWAMRQQNPTYFLYQAVSKQLPVRERVNRLERKQAIFILMDGSGSMSGEKHTKATGVVMNRLKAVVSGDAEVYLSVFDTQLSNMESAKTPEEARALIKKFAQENFSGGGTDISAAVKAAHDKIEEMIKSGAALYRPEVVVLTDEDQSIAGLRKADIPGTRVHGFAMGCPNEALVRFAQSTGGVGKDNF